MFTVSVQRDGYLLAAAVGRAELGDLCGMAGLVAEVARFSGLKQAVLDLLAVEPLLTTEEHEQLGNAIARILHWLQVASVIAFAERVSVSELVAQRAGLNLKTFTNLVDAEQWLQIGA
jgi:hypothetical protein